MGNGGQKSKRTRQAGPQGVVEIVEGVPQTRAFFRQVRAEGEANPSFAARLRRAEERYKSGEVSELAASVEVARALADAPEGTTLTARDREHTKQDGRWTVRDGRIVSRLSDSTVAGELLGDWF